MAPRLLAGQGKWPRTVETVLKTIQTHIPIKDALRALLESHSDGKNQLSKEAAAKALLAYAAENKKVFDANLVSVSAIRLRARALGLQIHPIPGCAGGLAGREGSAGGGGGQDGGYPAFSNLVASSQGR